MKRFVKIMVFVLLVGLLLATGLMVTLMLQDKPLLSGDLTMSPADIKRAKQLIASHDPRGLRNGESKWLVIRETDFTLMVNYVLQHFPLFRDSGWLRIETEPDRLTLEGTVLLTDNPLGHYLNIRIIFTDKGQIPELTSIHIGNLSVPRNMAVALLGYLLDSARQRADLQLALQSINDISMNRDTLVIHYQWNSKLLEYARSALVPQADQQRLVYYQQLLADYIHQSVSSRRVSLSHLLLPLFRQAHVRSSSMNAVVENRSAIIVLAAYVNGINLANIVPSVTPVGRSIRRKVVLRGRHDLAQHFILSAAISAVGGSDLSNMIGMFKEIEDSRYGSGFNFADLTADRTGTRFGDMATLSHQEAIAFQKRFLLIRSEAELLPQVADLMRGMSDTDFTRKFRDTGSPAYKKMINEIDRRIISLKLYNGK